MANKIYRWWKSGTRGIRGLGTQCLGSHRVAGLLAHIFLLQSLPTSAFQHPPVARSDGGVIQGMPSPWCHPVWSVQQHSSTALIPKKAHTACSSGCLQKQVLAFSPGSWNAGVQSERNKNTASFLSSWSIHSVKIVQDAVCSVGSLSSSSCRNLD